MQDGKCQCKQKNYAQEMCDNFTPVNAESWQDLAKFSKENLGYNNIKDE